VRGTHPRQRRHAGVTAQPQECHTSVVQHRARPHEGRSILRGFLRREHRQQQLQRPQRHTPLARHLRAVSNQPGGAAALRQQAAALHRVVVVARCLCREPWLSSEVGGDFRARGRLCRSCQPSPVSVQVAPGVQFGNIYSTLGWHAPREICRSSQRQRDSSAEEQPTGKRLRRTIAGPSARRASSCEIAVVAVCPSTCAALHALFNRHRHIWISPPG
jgi:hypothetical protein